MKTMDVPYRRAGPGWLRVLFAVWRGRTHGAQFTLPDPPHQTEMLPECVGRICRRVVAGVGAFAFQVGPLRFHPVWSSFPQTTGLWGGGDQDCLSCARGLGGPWMLARVLFGSSPAFVLRPCRGRSSDGHSAFPAPGGAAQRPGWSPTGAVPGNGYVREQDGQLSLMNMKQNGNQEQKCSASEPGVRTWIQDTWTTQGLFSM